MMLPCGRGELHHNNCSRASIGATGPEMPPEHFYRLPIKSLESRPVVFGQGALQYASHLDLNKLAQIGTSC